MVSKFGIILLSFLILLAAPKSQAGTTVTTDTGSGWIFNVTPQPNFGGSPYSSNRDNAERWERNRVVTNNYLNQINGNIEQIRTKVEALCQSVAFNESFDVYNAFALDSKLYAAIVTATNDSNNAVDTFNNMHRNGLPEGSIGYPKYKESLDILNDGKKKLSQLNAIRSAWNQKLNQRYEERKQSIEPARKTSITVDNAVEEASLSLHSPEVSSRLEPATTQWIQEQMNSSQAIAHQAESMAWAGTASDNNIRLLGDYAVSTTYSIKSFLTGVAEGTYQGLITIKQAATAFYNNAGVIDHLAVGTLRAIHAIVDPYGPSGLATSAKNALLNDYVTLKAGTAEEIGKATGELVPNILLALATEGTSTVEATALEELATNIVADGIAEPVGERLLTGVKAWTPADVAAEEAAAKNIVDSAKSNVVTEWVGKDSKFIRNIKDDVVILSKDGTKRVRFDLNHTFPHENPHGHAEEFINGKWIKSGPLYPTDVPHK